MNFITYYFSNELFFFNMGLADFIDKSGSKVIFGFDGNTLISFENESHFFLLFLLFSVLSMVFMSSLSERTIGGLLVDCSFRIKHTVKSWEIQKITIKNNLSY